MVSLAAALVSAIAVGGLAMLYVRRPRARIRSRRPAKVVEGLDLTPTQFWVAVLGVAAATFLFVLALTGLMIVSIIPALVVATLPKAYFAQKRARRVAGIQESWPDGLRDLLSSIRSGASLPTALEDLARLGPMPLREAFQGYGVYARSLGVVTALEMVREDLADPTSDRVIEVLILAYERGGGVVTQILEDLAEATTKDLWALEQVRSENLEQKINSRIVFVLPWLVLVAMTTRSGAFREFYSTSVGVAVVVVGGLLSAVGIIVSSRLSAIPAEPRVFGGAR